MTNQVSEWVRAFAAPRWFRGAIAALVLVAVGVAIGLRVSSPPVPSVGPVPPAGVAPLNLPPLPVEGRRLTPEAPAPGLAAGLAPAEPAAPAGEAASPVVETPPAVEEPVAVVATPAESATAGRPAPRTWREIQDDMFGAGRP